jgi:uncharacterized protein YjiS (DUF1127 family)
MDNTSIHDPAGHRDLLHGAVERWHRWRRRLRTRAELREMDARGLADIGIDAETARRESGKFFWQG